MAREGDGKDASVLWGKAEWLWLVGPRNQLLESKLAQVAWGYVPPGSPGRKSGQRQSGTLQAQDGREINRQQEPKQ